MCKERKWRTQAEHVFLFFFPSFVRTKPMIGMKMPTVSTYFFLYCLVWRGKSNQKSLHNWQGQESTLGRGLKLTFISHFNVSSFTSLWPTEENLCCHLKCCSFLLITPLSFLKPSLQPRPYCIKGFLWNVWCCRWSQVKWVVNHVLL